MPREELPRKGTSPLWRLLPPLGGRSELGKKAGLPHEGLFVPLVQISLFTLEIRRREKERKR